MEKKEHYFGFKELRRYLRAALKRAEAGDKVIITVYGKPIAQIVQYTKRRKKSAIEKR